MIPLAVRAVPFRPTLGQPVAAVPMGMLVSVVDRQGKPAPGVEVIAYSNGQEAARGLTDVHGDIRLPVSAASYDLAANYNSHRFWKTATAEQLARGETIVFDMPFCVRDPIVKPIDIGLLLAAGALAGAGVYWKIQPLTVAGEVVFGAAVFSIVYRLSCL